MAIKNESRFGYETGNGEDATYDGMKKRVMDEIEKHFRPEFLNRLDDVIIFRHLTTADLKNIIDLELAKVRERLQERGYQLVLTDAAKEFVINKGKRTEYGARPLRRSLETWVEDPLAEELLRGEFAGKEVIEVDGVLDEESGRIIRLQFTGKQAEKDEETVPAGADSDGDKKK